MSTRTLDYSKLKDVARDDQYGASTVWSRWEMEARNDPYLAFFSDETRRALANAVITGISDKHYEHLIVSTPETMAGAVRGVLDKTPLCTLLTDDFKAYITNMFVCVTFPEITSR